MPRFEGNRLYLDGVVDIQTVAALLPEGAAHVRAGAEVIDFGAVTEVDSSAVALALAWLREARAAGRTIAFANLPPAMANLARLYAVSDLIPVAER